MTNIKIYNGNQIGGCVVVVETDQAKVVVDFGSNLSGSKAETIELEGLTYGTPTYDAVFFTHYHGDHIGRMQDILPDIPLYVGAGAKKIMNTIAKAAKNEHLYVLLNDEERVFEITEKQTYTIKDIAITPYMVDHSAYEAFMFFIETPNKKILHTGDFREHGYRGEKGLIPTIQNYITMHGRRMIDTLIIEGTMLSREDDPIYSEADLQRDAIKYFKDHRYVFLICSSTNIDSLAGFYQAGQRYGMNMYCNWYVEEQLGNFTEIAGAKSDLYKFENVHQWSPLKKLVSKNGWEGCQLDLLDQYGFITIIKGNEDYGRWIDDFESGTGKKACVIYSMWKGYITPGKCYDKELAAFCQKYNAKVMHTSGHAYAKTLKKVIEVVDPQEEIIPIHTEYAEGLRHMGLSKELEDKIK